MDPTSRSNSHEIAAAAMHLSLKADFERQCLEGYVDISFDVLAGMVSRVVLDTRFLEVRRVDDLLAEKELKFNLSEHHAAFGQALEIQLHTPLAQGDKLILRISYATTPQSTAIQWLNASQTAGKKYPYMFTQCQAIHCRSLLPCQDTPSIKTKYTAELEVPRPLVALMSALSTTSKQGDSTTTYAFKQDVPIPAYLIAIAIGNLVSREIGPRSRVWSEPETVDAGAFEFADTEKFIATAESFLTPYVWGRYDLLLLPPSFPYGGMENPMLTFVTPTLLAGDRSLANVVAHEIAHSWSGNLVTNRNWESFWLNEGWTVFIERKIMGRLHGPAQLDLQAYEGLNTLKNEVARIGATHSFTSLTPTLHDQDPDDAFSSIPYEKGFFFLMYLQQVVGGPGPMEEFARAYFTKFAYKTLTSAEFRDFFMEYFSTRCPDAVRAIDWETWLTAPGMPPVIVPLDLSLVEAAKQLATRWKSAAPAPATGTEMEGWSTAQKIVFLDELLAGELPPLPAVQAMDRLYALSQQRNAEIRLRWQTLLLRVGADAALVYPMVTAFITEQGRMKFVRPLYRELARTPAGREVAERTFRAHHKSYHAIAAKMVARDLGLTDLA